MDDIKKEEDVTTQDYFKKSDVIISPLDDYNIELSVLEKFVTDARIEGNNILIVVVVVKMRLEK